MGSSKWYQVSKRYDVIDLVVTTCDRLNHLKWTLKYIKERTTTPYRLTIVDDASIDGTVEYLRGDTVQGPVDNLILRSGWVDQVILRPTRVGPGAYLRDMLYITTTDPIVVTDDDILCPRLEPDWLAQGLQALKDHPELAVIALNNPQCNVRHSRHVQLRGPQVTTCKFLGGTFLFIRRRALEGYVPATNSRLGPIKTWLRTLSEPRGYLTNVYCQHIGMESVRTSDDLSVIYHDALPRNGSTLEPIAKYRG